LAVVDSAALHLEAAAKAAADGDAVAAQISLRQALLVQETTLGPSHGDLAATLNNLAVVCEWLNESADAERFYRRSYEVALSAFEPDHPQVATSRRNLEDFCRTRGIPFDEPAAAPVAHVAPTRVEAAREEVVATKASPAPQTAAPRWSRNDTRRWATVGMIAAASLVAILAGNILRGWSARSVPPDVSAAGTSREPRSHPPQMTERSATQTTAEPTTLKVDDAVADRGGVDRPLPETPVAVPPAPATATGRREEPTPHQLAAGDAQSGTASELKVSSVQLCRELSRGPGPWTCSGVGEPLSGGIVFFYTRVASPSAADIQHDWYQDERLIQSVTLRIAANAHEGYRTYSQRTVAPASGAWRVELRAGGTLLSEERFMVH